VPNLTRRDLRSFLPEYDLARDDEVDQIIFLVRSWLLDATDLDELPAPLPEILWGAALELAALVADNKVSHAQKTIGPTSRSWPMASRRDAIIAGVRARWARERMQPVGSYPPAPEAALYTSTSGGWVRVAGWIDPGDFPNIGRPS
jgi:hypothetical protein